MKFKKLNWSYALGEIFLIFVGISLAISFSNWNESRKLAQVEIDTLTELKDGITKDLADIKGNIQGFQKRVKAQTMLIDHIEANWPVTDSLMEFLPFLFGYTSFITNTAPYETLKVRGVDLIKNNELRLKVLDYYDIKQDWIVSTEKSHLEHYTNYIKPFVLKHLSLKEGLRPLNFEGLKKDPYILQIMRWSYINDGYILSLYEDLKLYAENLILSLEREIEKLN